MTSLNGATVLITGANGGLGTALVHAAIDRGAVRVYAGARHPKDWGNDRIVPLTLDLTDPASTASLRQAITARAAAQLRFSARAST